MQLTTTTEIQRPLSQITTFNHPNALNSILLLGGQADVARKPPKMILFLPGPKIMCLSLLLPFSLSHTLLLFLLISLSCLAL
jgi:hypothetical protein